VTEISILQIAEQERDNTLQLISDHVAKCAAPRAEPGTLTGSCLICISLAGHRDRCEEQVRMLTTEDPNMEALF
jgi:hypothetical protein